VRVLLQFQEHDAGSLLHRCEAPLPMHICATGRKVLYSTRSSLRLQAPSCAFVSSSSPCISLQSMQSPSVDVDVRRKWKLAETAYSVSIQRLQNPSCVHSASNPTQVLRQDGNARHSAESAHCTSRNPSQPPLSHVAPYTDCAWCRTSRCALPSTGRGTWWWSSPWLQLHPGRRGAG